MPLDNRGTTLLECLVALTVFAVGALGAGATIGLSARLAGEARRAAAAGRRFSDDFEGLRQLVQAAAGNCPSTLPPAATGPGGVVIQWSGAPGIGGLTLRYVISYPTVRGLHADTGQGFLACR